MSSAALLKSFEELDVEITHHFGGGVYMKQADFPPGVVLAQHVHMFDHLAVLVSGKVELEVDSQKSRHEGFKVLTIPALKSHKVTSLSPVTWLCVWATDALDPDEADQKVIA
jgi:hypothetical protein